MASSHCILCLCRLYVRPRLMKTRHHCHCKWPLHGRIPKKPWFLRFLGKFCACTNGWNQAFFLPSVNTGYEARHFAPQHWSHCGSCCTFTKEWLHCNSSSCSSHAQKWSSRQSTSHDQVHAEEMKTDTSTASLGPIVTIATDGDAKWRLAFDQFLRVNSKPSTTIANILDQLPLIDIAVGDGNVLVHFDDKHVITRLQEVLKSYSRGSVIHKVELQELC